MANKYEMITQLADYTAGRILKDPHDYMGFLRCAGQNYKYSFQDQILIYAQKPDATACAEFETWKELGRYVNRGTKGIALLVDDGYRKLRHVFDIADTNSFAGRKVYVWQMENRFESTVMEALNNSFGPLDDSGGFLPLLIAAASNAVEDNLPDYLLDLEDMKGVPSPDTFKALLANSVIYMVMHRCGMEPDTLLFERDFQGIDEFASTDSFMILGCASSSISEMLLREIGDTVRNMEITEKKRNRTFAIDDGSAPKFANCEVGARWFQRHGQWMDGDATPVPGCIIFFDWVEDNGTQDGQPEHVGIVTRMEDGYVWTVEGNTNGDMCCEKCYQMGSVAILGYGII